jgi:hypothetical protein
MASIRRLSKQQLIVAVAVLATIGNVFAYLLDVSGNDEGSADIGGFIIVTLIAIGIAALLILWLVPRELSQRDTGRAARSALILAALAFVTLVAFWTALPFALGVPALYLAAVALERSGGIGDVDVPPERAAAAPNARDYPSDRRGMALAAAILAALALVLGLVSDIIG